MNAKTDFPDAAPAGYVWTLAESYCPADNWRPHLRTLPHHGWFTSKKAADERAAAVRGDRIVTPILVEIPKAAEDVDG